MPAPLQESIGNGTLKVIGSDHFRWFHWFFVRICSSLCLNTKWLFKFLIEVIDICMMALYDGISKTDGSVLVVAGEYGFQIMLHLSTQYARVWTSTTHFYCPLYRSAMTTGTFQSQWQLFWSWPVGLQAPCDPRPAPASQQNSVTCSFLWVDNSALNLSKCKNISPFASTRCQMVCSRAN